MPSTASTTTTRGTRSSARTGISAVISAAEISFRSTSGPTGRSRSSCARNRTQLSEREKRHLVVSSKPYRFRSSGELHLSGLEHVEHRPGRGAGRVTLAAGEYAVTIHLIAWEDERGAKDRKGRPKPGALPDFVVLVRPKRPGTYRTKVETFGQPRGR